MDGVSHVASVYGIYDPFSVAFPGYFEVDFQSYPVGQIIDFSRLTGSGVEPWPYLFSFSSISRLLLPDDG